MRNIPVAVSDSTYKRLQAMEIPIGNLTSHLLTAWINEHEDDSGLLFIIMHINKRIASVESELSKLRGLEKELEFLKGERARYEQVYFDSSKSIELHHLMQFLNKRIVLMHFNAKELRKRHADVLRDIKKYNPDFKLEDQIEQVKQWKESFVI